MYIKTKKINLLSSNKRFKTIGEVRYKSPLHRQLNSCCKLESKAQCHFEEILKASNFLVMVNLPKEIDTGKDTLDKAFSTVPPPEPDNLKDLEYIATRTANFMNPVSWHPKCHQIVMNRVREFYNLEFKMLCNKCGTPHRQDEITAPER